MRPGRPQTIEEAVAAGMTDEDSFRSYDGYAGEFVARTSEGLVIVHARSRAELFDLLALQSIDPEELPAGLELWAPRGAG